MVQLDESDIDAKQITRRVYQVMRHALRDDFPVAVSEFCLPTSFARALEAMDSEQTDRFCDGLQCAPLLALREDVVFDAATLVLNAEGSIELTRVDGEWQRRLVGLQIALLTHICTSLRADVFATRVHWTISHRLAELLAQLDAAQIVEVAQLIGGHSIVTAESTLSVQVGMDLEMSGNAAMVAQMVALNQLCTVRTL